MLTVVVKPWFAGPGTSCDEERVSLCLHWPRCSWIHVVRHGGTFREG